MEPDKKLKVLIVGSGGREHALVLAVKRSPMLDSLVCAPETEESGATAKR